MLIAWVKSPLCTLRMAFATVTMGCTTMRLRVTLVYRSDNTKEKKNTPKLSISSNCAASTRANDVPTLSFPTSPWSPTLRGKRLTDISAPSFAVCASSF